MSSEWLERKELPEAKLYENYVSYQAFENGEEVSSGTVLFSAPKHFKFADPDLKVKVKGDEITVSAKAYAKSIEIRNENDDLILSDNFFDLNGDEKTVKILKGEAKNIKVRSVYSIR